MFYIIAPLLTSLAISLIAGRILIPVLRSKKLGQKILEIGPRWHKSKEGTPIMGGLLFIGGILIVVLSFGIHAIRASGRYDIFFTFLLALGFGTIGFIDDYAKLVKKENKGLSAVQKLFLQFSAATAYLLAMQYFGILSTVVYFPFFKAFVDFGIFFYIFALLGIVYFANSANFTDGIDGLCGSVTVIMSIFFIMAFRNVESDLNTGGTVLASALLGGLLGFLYYNFYPAKIFMGDTGSQFLGGIIAGMAFWLGVPIILLFVGIIHIIESFSVVIQVTGYKLTGKRIFKMSPIHHHFELCGWSEKKIVFVFSLITAVMCAIAYAGLFYV